MSQKPPFVLSKKSSSILSAGFFLGLLMVLSVGLLVATPYLMRYAQNEKLLKKDTRVDSYNLGLNPTVPREPILKITDLGSPPPVFSSRAVLAEDLDTEQLLYQKNSHERLSPASTTKLMTAIIATEHFQSGDILTVFPEDIVGGSTMGLRAGEKLSFRSLLYGMLLNSGNDAAFTIASNYPGGLNMFILQMNKKAKDLGLNNTNFQNPAGFDGPEHYSSAFDLAKIAKVAVSNPQIAKIVATKETSITTTDSSKLYELKNLNQLLEEQGILGIKTGTTELAGENFVGLVSRNNHKILTVVLKSDDRFGETKSLINWAYNNFQWKLID